jgi:glutathione S-transferase
MHDLELRVLSLRYSSWSMRAWLALTHAGADFRTTTVDFDFDTTHLTERRKLGSVAGLFPVLYVDSEPVHESLAICETAAELYPAAGLWPASFHDRARARAICAEMVGNFSAIRNEMTCHLFGRTGDFAPSAEARANIERVFEIWSESLHRSGGPFLFGSVTVADFFYFPVLTRFRTYGIELNEDARGFAQALDGLPAVNELIDKARTEPLIARYDDYIVSLGGDAAAAL